MFLIINFLAFDTCFLTFPLCHLPYFFRNNCFMYSIINRVIVLFHNMILITGSCNLFILTATISEFSTINRIV